MCFRKSSLTLLLYHILALDRINIASTNEITRKLCGLTTDELIRFYGYEAEVHFVTTEDGYILTIFRCYSKKLSSNESKPVILQHGLLVSSDDFCVNPPDQSLAYVLADAGFDVWLPNSRGNFYSRKHLFKDPNLPSSGFWEFSWYEMGIFDQPAVIDYILRKTSTSKLYYIGFSQGTTSIMVLLSEKPEYNDKIYVASLLAPVGYLSHVDALYRLASVLVRELDVLRRFEFLPRSRALTEFLYKFCVINLQACNDVIDLICGPSENQRNNTILPAFVCHVPSGASKKQVLHYGQEIRFRFFGKYMRSLKRPPDFSLSRITAPISLHYSTADNLADASDVEALIPKLNNAIFIQRLDDKFNHVDFLWSMNSASLIYSNIINIFQRYQ